MTSGHSGLPGQRHKLLARQIRRHFGHPEQVPPDLEPFLDTIEEAYAQTDEDRALLEHSLETVSRELANRLQRMESAIGEREAVKRAYAQLEATQEQLRQAQKMEAIGRLAGGIAHDFNNLLTVISGNVELMAETAALPDGHDALLHEVAAAAQRAARLTSHLLAFSRKQTLQTSIFDLSETVTDLQPILRRAVGPVAQLSVECAPAFVRADRTQLDQVLLNLVINARDAIDGNGQITVTCGVSTRDAACEVAHGDVLPAGRYATLTVRDNGSGIPEGIRDRIFEPFFTTKAQGEGTGLGLSMVYGLVRQLGGWVALESRLGSGTTVEIHLPLEAAEAVIAPLPARARRDVRTREPLVLVVDDEDGVRRLIATILTRHGFRVVEACNGLEALMMLQPDTMSVDLVVSDVIMPELDGRELSRRLQQGGPDVPVLFVSGYSHEEMADLGGAFEDGTTLLAKPFSASQLLDSVSALLRERGDPQPV